jgi:hypothetical protein
MDYPCNNTKNLLEIPIRPIIKSMIKKLKEPLNKFVQHVRPELTWERQPCIWGNDFLIHKGIKFGNCASCFYMEAWQLIKSFHLMQGILITAIRVYLCGRD